MNRDEEFSDLSAEERTARCLELAQLALGRAETSTEANKELNLTFARCWQSLAKQFDAIQSLHTARACGIALVQAVPARQADQIPVVAPQSETDFFQLLAPAGI